MTGYKQRLDMFIAANGEYWGSGHGKYPAEDWRQEVCNGGTRLGYWEWVFQQADANGDPDTPHEPRAGRVEPRTDKPDDVICKSAGECRHFASQGCYHGSRHESGGGCRLPCSLRDGVMAATCGKVDK